MSVVDQLCFVVPSFSLDGPCALELVSGLNDLGVAPQAITVLETKEKPFTKETRGALAELALLTPSKYERKQRLLDCQELADSYVTKLEETGARYVVGMDSDTLLVSLRSHEELVRKDAHAMAFGWTDLHFAGCCRTIRADVAVELARAFRDPNWIAHLPDRVPNDSSMGWLIDRLFGCDKTLRHWWRRGARHGFLTAWHYGEDPRSLRDVVRGFHAVTFGNRRKIKSKDLQGCESKRELVALTMAKARAFLRE